jgi:type II secretory pathway pseudopilin PulG
VARSGIRIRAFTLIEGLVATFIMVVAIAAVFGAWSVCFQSNQQVVEVTSAAQIAQSVIETAKVYGAANMPLGTYNSSSQTGSWTGAYSQSSGWVSGATGYYNYQGAQLATSTSSGVYFKVSVTITDSSVLQGSGSSYSLQQTSIRGVVVTVSNNSTGVVDYSMATNLTQGGV